jgi:DNA-binding transcriptional LysR family regulator
MPVQSPVALTGMRDGTMLTHYRVFVEVAATSSMSEAAWNLDLDVSVVSRHIATLERIFDCSLFERHRRGVRLTEAGAVLNGYFADMIRLEDRARQEIADLRGLRRGSLRIVSTEGAIVTPLAKAISTYSAAHPMISIELFRASSEQIIRWLRDGHADIGAGLNIEIENDIEILATFRDTLSAVVSKNHPLANRKNVPLGEVFTYPVGCFERNSGVARTLRRHSARSGVEMTTVLTTNSLAALRRFCTNDIAVSIVCPYSVQEDITRGNLVAVPLDARGPIYVRTDLCIMKNTAQNFAVSEFIRILVDEYGFSASVEVA